MTIEEKQRVKAVVREMLHSEPETLKTIIAEILEEEAQQARREKVQAIIKRDFERFKETFKALA